MQPIRIAFQSIFTATDQDFRKYKGIERINKIVERETENLKPGTHLTNVFKNNVNLYYADLEKLFFEDFSAADFRAESAAFELKSVGQGPASPGITGHSFTYEVEVVVTSIPYTCIQILENGLFVCFSEESNELKFIHHRGKTLLL